MFDSKFVRETIDTIVNKGLHAFLGVVNTEVGKAEKTLLNLETSMDIANKNIEDLENRLYTARVALNETKGSFDEHHKILNKLKKLNLRI